MLSFVKADDKEDMIMGTLKYKGYTGSIEYSEEDNCLYGEVLGMSKDFISYEGKDVDSLRKDFEEAVDYYLNSCKKEVSSLESLIAAI